MTGRGMGYCAGYPTPGYMNPGFGRGMGFGGGGRGWRHMYYATGMPGWMRFGAPPTWTPGDEAEALRQQAEALKATLTDIERRLNDLTKTNE